MGSNWDATDNDIVAGFNSFFNININTSNSYPQPVYAARASMAKFEAADAVGGQNMAAGESKITVNANGSIQFK